MVTTVMELRFNPRTVRSLKASKLGCSSCEMKEEKSQGRVAPRRQVKRGGLRSRGFNNQFAPTSAPGAPFQRTTVERSSCVSTVGRGSIQCPSPGIQVPPTFLGLITGSLQGHAGIHIYIKLVRDGAKSRAQPGVVGAQPGVVGREG